MQSDPGISSPPSGPRNRRSLRGNIVVALLGVGLIGVVGVLFIVLPTPVDLITALLLAIAAAMALRSRSR